MPKQSAPATVHASIAKLCSSKGHQTVVMIGSTSCFQRLPLSLVTVTLRPGELFMATGANGQVRYTEDLEEAWWFTRYNGTEAVPDAIQVLVPCISDNGFSTLNRISVYERATALPE